MRYSTDQLRTLLTRLEKHPASALETETLEFKEWSREWEHGESGRRKFYRMLAEYAVCFANHRGGALVLGVKDRVKGRAQAVAGCGAYNLHELRERVYDLTDPHILVEAEEVFLDDLGVRLLIIHIPQGMGVHTTTDGVAKMRVGTECKPMTGAMRQQRLVEQRHLPQHTVEYLRMRSETDYERREIYACGLLRALEETERNIELYNRITTVKAGLFHYEVKDFPEESYREALLNAMQHRDYLSPAAVFIKHYPDRLEVSNPGSFLAGISPENIFRQDSYPRNRRLTEMLRRIGLVERSGVGVKRIFCVQLSSGKPPPSYWSSGAIVRLTLYNGSLDEAFTRFVRQREREGKSLGLDELLVLFTLRRQRELSLAEATRTLQLPRTDTHALLMRMVREGLLERSGVRRSQLFRLSSALYQTLGESIAYIREAGIDAIRYEEMVLAYVRQYGAITNRITRELLGVDIDTAKRLLGKLCSEDKLTRIGKRRGAHYVLPNPD